MNLSLIRKAGAVHVRGGKLVTVIADHKVSTGTYSPESNHPDVRRTFTSAWETARAGDLAVEIVAVATGNVLGHAYLSGPAICLHSYNSVPTWFRDEPEPAWRVSLDRVRDYSRQVLPDDGDGASPLGTPDEMIAAISRAKYAPATVVAFELQLADLAEVKECVEWLDHSIRLEPTPAAEGGRSDLAGIDITRTRADVIGFLFTNKSLRGPLATVHLQLASRSGPYCASQFQVQLVLSSPTLETVDLFDAADWHRRYAAARTASA